MKSIQKSLITGCAIFWLIVNAADLAVQYSVISEAQAQRADGTLAEQAHVLSYVMTMHSGIDHADIANWTISELKQLGYVSGIDWTIYNSLFTEHYPIAVQIWHQGNCYGEPNGQLCNAAAQFALQQDGFSNQLINNKSFRTFVLYDLELDLWLQTAIAEQQIEQKIWQQFWSVNALQLLLTPIGLLLTGLWFRKVLKALDMVNQVADKPLCQPLITPRYKELLPWVDHHNALHANITGSQQARYHFCVEQLERIANQSLGIKRALQEGEEGYTRARYHNNKLAQQLNVARMWLLLTHAEPQALAQPSSLHHILTSSCRDFWYLARRMNRRLQVGNIAKCYTTSLPPTVLNAMLDALLDNALRYSPPQGQVIVKAQLCGQRRSFVWLSVADSGSGLSQQQLDAAPDLRLPTAWPCAQLGLGIVKAVCKHYAIELVVSRCPTLGGTQICLGFPVAVRSGSEVNSP